MLCRCIVDEKHLKGAKISGSLKRNLQQNDISIVWLKEIQILIENIVIPNVSSLLFSWLKII